MKNSIVPAVLAVLVLSTAPGAWAGGQKGGAQMDRQQQTNQDRKQVHRPDKLQMETRSQEQDRVHQQLDPIYGGELMSQQERLEYREQLRAKETTQERDQLKAEHRSNMQQRAKERGVTVQEPIYGQNMMSQEDKLRYREQLQTMQTEQEREQFMAEHRAKMQSRAQQQTLQPDDVEEAE